MRRFVLAGVILQVLFLVSLAWGASVTVVGEGATRQAAINNGLSEAVKQGLGVYVSSHSRVAQNVVSFDRITSASAGYVKSYRVLAEGKDPVSELYKVKLEAELDDIKLKSAVEEFLNNPQFQRTFQGIRFDRRRVIVLYKKRGDFDLPYQSRAVQTIMGLINDGLCDKGFRVFLPEELVRIQDRLVEEVADDETAIRIARQETGDAVVIVSFEAAKQPVRRGYYCINGGITLKAYDLTTGEFFATVRKNEKLVTENVRYSVADGAERISSQIASEAVKNLVTKIVKRFSGARQKFVFLVLRNVNLNQQDNVEDVLEILGWGYKIVRQAGNYMEIEIFSEADPTSVRQILRRNFKKMHLGLMPAEMVGSRIVFNGILMR